jgi:hypothetical protein
VAPRNEIANASFLIEFTVEERSGSKEQISILDFTFFKVRNGRNFLACFRAEDTGLFKNFFRMSSEDSEMLISLVGQQIAKEEASCR